MSVENSLAPRESRSNMPFSKQIKSELTGEKKKICKIFRFHLIFSKQSNIFSNAHTSPIPSSSR